MVRARGNSKPKRRLFARSTLSPAAKAVRFPTAGRFLRVLHPRGG